MDISARNLSSILAWELYFTYDRRILEVVGKDVRIFLAETPNSNVFDFSDPVPSGKGVYRIAAADLGPSLTGVDGKHISDADGDGIFDGTTFDGQVAVGLRCSPDSPNPPIEDIEDIVIIRPEVDPTAVVASEGSPPAPASPSPSGTSSGSPQPTSSLGGQPAARPVPTQSVVSGRGGASNHIPGWFYAFLAGAGLIAGASIVIIIRSGRRSK